MNTFRIVLLVLAGLGFLGFGVWFLIDPIAPLAATGIAVSGAPAPTELRAFYGGLEVGLGLLLLAAAKCPSQRRAGLWLVLATNGGIGLARLLGFALDGTWVPFFTAAIVWELGFATLATLALRRTTAERGSMQG